MNNTFKKFLAVLLSVLTCLSCGVTAFAQSEEAEETGYICDYYFHRSAVVVTLDSEFVEKGEAPDIQVEYRKEYGAELIETTQLSKDRISLEIYEHNGNKYPQIFIDTDFCYSVVSIEIEAGAYVTESGEKSTKLTIPKSKMNVRFDEEGFTLECEFEAYEIVDNLLDLANMRSEHFVTVGCPVKVNVFVGGNHADAWLEKAELTYTVNGKTVEITSDEFIPEETGEYVVEFRLNDMINKKVKFKAVSERKAYFDNLGQSGKILLLSPLEFFFGLFAFFFAPGFGTIGGPALMLDALKQIPRFFNALVDGPEYRKHTV